MPRSGGGGLDCGQRLARLADGTCLYIAFASTQEQSKLICAQWTGDAEFAAFLIEPVSMEFETFA